MSMKIVVEELEFLVHLAENMNDDGNPGNPVEVNENLK